MTSRRLPTCIVPGPFWGSPAHVVACLGASDVTNQARLRMLSACVCMLWPSPAVLLRIRLPVHRSLCVWFSLSDALLVQHGPLHSGCAPPNGALCLLGCAPLFSVWFLFCLLSGPNPSKWTSPALLLGAYRFQSSKVDLSSSSAFGLLASVSICLPHKTIAERPKVVRTRGVFNM